MGAVENRGGIEGPEGRGQHAERFALLSANQIEQARGQHVKQNGEKFHRQHVEHPVIRNGQMPVQLPDNI